MAMNQLLSGKTALITGAAGGIGFEIAKEYAREGAAVVISDINREAAEAAASKLKDEGFESIAAACDVTKEDEMIGAIETVQKQYGRLDILVNNAGLQHVSPIDEFPTDRFEFLIKVMLTAPFVATKHAFPIMKNKNSAESSTWHP